MSGGGHGSCPPPNTAPCPECECEKLVTLSCQQVGDECECSIISDGTWVECKSCPQYGGTIDFSTCPGSITYCSGGGSPCCVGECDPNGPSCVGCTWPGLTISGPGGTLDSTSEGPVDSNATVQNYLNYAFGNGKVAWNVGYPNALAGCNTQWRFYEYSGPYTACATTDSGYCRRFYFKIALLKCDAGGSTTDITSLAITELVPGWIFTDRCEDADDGDTSGCGGCCGEAPTAPTISLICDNTQP